MKVIYRIVEHDGGWAYQVGDVYSEAFDTHDEARAAAERAAEEHRQGGETTDIEFETADGKWHQQRAEGGDRPETAVQEGEASKRD